MRLNLEKINPIKRAKIEKGIDLIEKCNAKEKVVDKMIIFGSSTGDECTEESDIDVCLISDCTTTNNVYCEVFGGLEIAMDDLVDVINFKRMGEQLRTEVLKNGVTVYEY